MSPELPPGQPAVIPEQQSYLKSFSDLIDEAPSSKHFYLWHCLRDYINRESKCWPGVREVAKRIKCDKDNVKGWADDLKALGWLDYEDVKLRRGVRRVYTLKNRKTGQPWLKQTAADQQSEPGSKRRKNRKNRKSVPRTPDTSHMSKVSSVDGLGCPAHTGQSVPRTPDVSQGAHQVSSPDLVSISETDTKQGCEPTAHSAVATLPRASANAARAAGEPSSPEVQKEKEKPAAPETFLDKLGRFEKLASEVGVDDREIAVQFYNALKDQPNPPSFKVWVSGQYGRETQETFEVFRALSRITNGRCGRPKREADLVEWKAGMLDWLRTLRESNPPEPQPASSTPADPSLAP